MRVSYFNSQFCSIVIDAPKRLYSHFSLPINNDKVLLKVKVDEIIQLKIISTQLFRN